MPVPRSFFGGLGNDKRTGGADNNFFAFNGNAAAWRCALKAAGILRVNGVQVPQRIDTNRRCSS
jgi:hypothetical protein